MKKIEANQCIKCGKAILPQDVINEIKEGAEYKVTIDTEYSGYCLNCALYGVGGINIEATRVDFKGDKPSKTERGSGVHKVGNDNLGGWNKDDYDGEYIPSNKGRFPANLLLTHHPDCEYKGKKKVEGITNGTSAGDKSMFGSGSKESRKEGLNYADKNGMETVSDWDCVVSCPVKAMDEQSGILESGDLTGQKGGFKEGCIYGDSDLVERYYKGDKGGASRYFNQFHFADEDFFRYTAKASKSERTCDGNVENDHPTVKPIELMKWLVRLVTPPEGLVVDPFCGSGTTCISAYEEGFNYIGMDSDKHSVEIARERIKYHKDKPSQLELFAN